MATLSIIVIKQAFEDYWQALKKGMIKEDSKIEIGCEVIKNYKKHLPGGFDSIEEIETLQSFFLHGGLEAWLQFGDIEISADYLRKKLKEGRQRQGGREMLITEHLTSGHEMFEVEYEFPLRVCAGFKVR